MRPLPLLAFAIATAHLPAQWALMNPVTSPSARRAGAAAFDSTGNRLLFVGGIQPSPSTILGQTWSWNGTAWTQLSPAGGTIPRWGHGLVRNTQNNRLIVFGGRSPTLSAFANDTQEWTGTAWQTVVTANAPSPRHVYGFAFDSLRNRAVLFGGRTSTQTLADTWEYDGVNWSQRTPFNVPPARQEMAMVYDSGLRRVVLFGGFDQSTNTRLNDTWLYNGSDWQQVTTSNSPSPRYRMASAFDSVRQRTVLYGGFDGTNVLTDTFEFNGSNWTNVATTNPLPGASTETYHGYDPVRRRFVLFGGFGTVFSSQTWEYNGANSGYFGTFGLGCPTAIGEPTLTSNTPRLNNPWTLTIGNVPTDCEFVLIPYGLSNTTSALGPLPADLAAIGLPGCALNVANDYVAAQVAVGGSATSTLAIPSTTALLNQFLFAQAVLLDIQPGGDAVLLATSVGGRALIGQ
ncbi:MAG: kelch repeat-containing protein [Planctomycetota bacterium]|jgi:hypothetical protein